MTYYSRIMDLYRQAEFPRNSDFLIVDKLIHECTNLDFKRKLMAEDRDVSFRDCLDLMRKFEAVNVTMKCLEESIKSTQISVTYKDPTKKSQSRGSRAQFMDHTILLRRLDEGFGVTGKALDWF